MRLDTENRGFARCGSCRFEWPTWEHFVIDPELRLLGFQGYRSLPRTNLLMFEHRCGSTVSVLTARLRHLLPPMDTDGLPSLRGTPQCPEHCLSLADVGSCDRHCVNARERELIRIVQELRGELPAQRS